MRPARDGKDTTKLASNVGALTSPSVSSLLRYAAAPQLLFAAGFFFLWLDAPRYREYRPLLLIGKAACVVCLFPLAVSLVGDPKTVALAFGLPFMGIALAFFVAMVDIASLAVLVGVKLPERPAEAPSASPGQTQDEIEKVENL
jgi:hypothetical protein